MKAQQPLTRPDYQFKTATVIDWHTIQVAVDAQGEYAVIAKENPLQVATKLREIADHIEEMEAQDDQ